ncbi:MAG TPA: signal peptidase II [Candidatus Limnocylindrales bacterium]|nr:signal peptidase II [Candidatus Limnocylindrales bacterium]
MEVRAGSARWGLFVGVAALVLALDQVSKALVVGRLAPGESLGVVDDLLRIVHGQNNGGLFGLFHGQATVFAVVSLVVIAVIVVYEARAGRSLLVTLALGLLLGGALGNLADRVRIGYVVDFVDAGIGGLRFFTFNVGDAAISCAILLLIVLAIRSGGGERHDRTEEANDRPTDGGPAAAARGARPGPGDGGPGDIAAAEASARSETERGR